MKSLKFFLSIGILVTQSIAAHADFDGAPIDLEKFRQSATQALKAERAPLRAPVEKVFFRDAAYAIDSPEIYDGASLYALGEKVELIEPKKEFYIARRLNLSSGEVETVFVRFIDASITEVAIPDSLAVSYLDTEISESELKELFEELKKTLGEQEYTYEFLRRFKRLAIDLKRPTAEGYLRVVEATRKIFGEKPKIRPNMEKYQFPFLFGAIQDLSNEKLVDLDKLRDVVQPLVEEGRKFVTQESVIPSEAMSSARRCASPLKVSK